MFLILSQWGKNLRQLSKFQGCGTPSRIKQPSHGVKYVVFIAIGAITYEFTSQMGKNLEK